MAFLNNLGKKISTAAEATASKAKEVAEITKLKSSINDEEKQIEKLFTEIGEKIYDLDKGKAESPVADLCAKIQQSQEKIQELHQKIEELRND